MVELPQRAPQKRVGEGAEEEAVGLQVVAVVDA